MPHTLAVVAACGARVSIGRTVSSRVPDLFSCHRSERLGLPASDCARLRSDVDPYEGLVSAAVFRSGYLCLDVGMDEGEISKAISPLSILLIL